MIRADNGQGLTEYALLMLMVAMVVIAILTLFGGALTNAFTTILNDLTRL